MSSQHHYNNIPTELFRSFAAINRLGSFSKAAEELDLTQPGISSQIKRLERILGGDLFVKRARGLGLSELGSRIEPFARRVLVLNDQIMAMAGRLPRQETVYIGIQNSFALKLLADAEHACRASTTKNYRFVCGNTQFLTEQLRSGYVDLVFMMIETEPRTNVIGEWSERIVWVCSPTLPLKHNEPVPFVARQGGRYDRFAYNALEERDIPYRIAFTAADLATLLAAVEAGIGVMIAPERVVSKSLAVAQNSILPPLPHLKVGVFCREGFDLDRHRSLVNAFVNSVQPPAAARE